MAQLLLETFNHMADADFVTKWTQIQLTQTCVGFACSLLTETSGIAAVGRGSGNGLRLKASTDSTAAITKTFRIVLDSPSPSGSTFIWGSAFRCVNPFAGIYVANTTQPCQSFVACGSLGGIHVWFRLNQSGQIQCYRGTTLLGTSSKALTQNVYHYIAIKVVLHATTGTVDVVVDGVQTGWLALTGQNTSNLGTTVWDEIICGPAGGGTSIEYNYSHMYAADASGTGWTALKHDVTIDANLPTGNGTNRDWTPSTGTDDYAVVDEASANGATDYLEESTVNGVVTMAFPDVPAGADIVGVQITAQGIKSGAGVAGHKAVVRLSGVDYEGTEVGLAGTYSFKRQGWALSPATSAAWGESEFNNAEIGAKKSL